MSNPLILRRTARSRSSSYSGPSPAIRSRRTEIPCGRSGNQKWRTVLSSMRRRSARSRWANPPPRSAATISCNLALISGEPRPALISTSASPVARILPQAGRAAPPTSACRIPAASRAFAAASSRARRLSPSICVSLERREHRLEGRVAFLQRESMAADESIPRVLLLLRPSVFRRERHAYAECEEVIPGLIGRGSVGEITRSARLHGHTGIVPLDAFVAVLRAERGLRGYPGWSWPEMDLEYKPRLTSSSPPSASRPRAAPRSPCRVGSNRSRGPSSAPWCSR